MSIAAAEKCSGEPSVCASVTADASVTHRGTIQLFNRRLICDMSSSIPGGASVARAQESGGARHTPSRAVEEKLIDSCGSIRVRHEMGSVEKRYDRHHLGGGAGPVGPQLLRQLFLQES